MSEETRSSTTFAESALEFISDGSVIGLGTGHAATDFIHALGRRVEKGLEVRGVPTSEASAALARQLHIPLISLSEIDSIDVAVDGADEVAPDLDLIKGYGGSLLREKIVAAAAKRLVIVVGEEKLVATLGTRGKLPVEVAPFGLSFCQRRIETLGFKSHPRMNGADLFVTDNSNYILDCEIPALSEPRDTEQALLAIPGVLDTGLFLEMAEIVIVQHKESVEIRRRAC